MIELLSELLVIFTALTKERDEARAALAEAIEVLKEVGDTVDEYTSESADVSDEAESAFLGLQQIADAFIAKYGGGK